MLIPFIYNLFKRHPGCMVMIQRMAPEDDEIYKGEFIGFLTLGLCSDVNTADR